jgi:hypothetical protein
VSVCGRLIETLALAESRSASFYDSAPHAGHAGAATHWAGLYRDIESQGTYEHVRLCPMSICKERKHLARDGALVWDFAEVAQSMFVSGVRIGS